MTGTSGTGTVGKALDVLDIVAAFGRPVRFSEVLGASPFPKATLYRFVQTLTRQRMLVFDPERQTYAPGLRLVRLAHAAWAQSSLGPIAYPHLDRLAQVAGETIHLAQLDHAQVLYLAKRNAASPVEMFSQAGKVGPAYCTGVGKAMLAHQPQDALAGLIAQQSFHRFTPQTLTTESALRADLAAVRARGHAFDREEHEPGIVCIARPILTRTGRCLGAVSITGQAARTSLDRLVGLDGALRTAVETIARDAESWRFPQTDISRTGKGELSR